MTKKINRDLILARHMTFETERLIIRKIRFADAADLLKYHADKETAKSAGFVPFKNLEDAQNDIVDFSYRYLLTQWCIELKATGQMIGDIGLKLEDDKAGLYYCLNRDFWNQGLMTEAASCLRDFCFNDLSIEVIEADHFADNPASGRVMEKIGMKPYGQIFSIGQGHAQFANYYALTKKDFLKISES